MNSPSSHYLLAGFLFAVLWSSASSIGKIGLQSADGLVLFTIRFLIAGVLLLAYSFFIQRDRLPRKKEWLHVMLFGSLNTTLYLGIFIIALDEVTAGVTSIALALNPLMIGTMTALWLKKPVAPAQWVSIAVGIIGVVIVSYPLLMNSYASVLGLVLMAVCMVAYSVGSVYYTSVSWKLSRTAINGWQVLIGGVLLSPFALLFYQKSSTFDTRFWFSVGWLVIPVSIGAVQLWLYLLKQDVVRASLWLFLCPIFGLLFAYVLLDEPITLFTYVGTGLVLVALFIGQRAMNPKA
ncbi:MAG: EamA family transporter [Cytophagales bacterium]|nr:EamA family transporter [Cytophagales bacterium]